MVFDGSVQLFLMMFFENLWRILWVFTGKTQLLAVFSIFHVFLV